MRLQQTIAAKLRSGVGLLNAVTAIIALLLVWALFPFALDAQVPRQKHKTLSNQVTRPPNIVLIMVDDLGWADLGCYGSEAVLTPRLDRMAEQGMLFTQAYSGSVVCAPARCTLMTGKHAGHCSIRVNSGGVPLLEEDVTIAELLRSRGYHTGGFGKWGLGDIGTTGAPERQGFERFFGYYHQFHAHLMYPEYLIDTGEKVAFPNNQGFHQPFRTTKFPARFVPESNPSTEQALTYAPYEIVDETLNFIRKHQREPFFCYASWTPPHGRRMIPENDEACQLYRGKSGWSDEAKVVASMITMTDRHVGQVFDLLQELDLDESTIVLFCSDHGAALRLDGELNSCGRLRGKKRTVFEGGLRIPLIVRWPGKIAPKSTSNHVCYLGDMLMTLSELAQIDPAVLPHDVDSISIVPTLLGSAKSQQNHEWLYWDWSRFNSQNGVFGDRMTALRKGDWKLLRNCCDEPWQLFDLATDVSEAKNVAKEHPELVEHLKKLMDQSSVANRQPAEPPKNNGKRFR